MLSVRVGRAKIPMTSTAPTGVKGHRTPGLSLTPDAHVQYYTLTFYINKF